jgi:tRNA modification GTPase
VSERAGTTRDIIELHLDLAGYPVILADTAGLRTTDDPIELEGIRRAEARAASADLTLLLVDQSDWPQIPDEVQARLSDPRILTLISKCDAGFEAPAPWIAFSAETGFGLDQLTAAIASIAEESLGGEALVPTRERHRAAVMAAEASLRRAVQAPLPELLAEDVRLAVRDLGRITGRVDVEDILDRIFSAFCIGK